MKIALRLLVLSLSRWMEGVLADAEETANQLAYTREAVQEVVHYAKYWEANQVGR